MTDLRKLVEDWCDAEESLSRERLAHQRAADAVREAISVSGAFGGDILRKALTAAQRAERDAERRVADTRMALRDAVGRTR